MTMRLRSLAVPAFAVLLAAPAAQDRRHVAEPVLPPAGATLENVTVGAVAPWSGRRTR